MFPEGDDELELCRVCANLFESSTMARLFDDVDATLGEIFRLVSGVEAQDELPELPKRCCLDCRIRLQEVEDLCVLCQEADLKLRQMIEPKSSGTVVMLEILQLSEPCGEDSGNNESFDEEDNEMEHGEEDSEELMTENESGISNSSSMEEESVIESIELENGEISIDQNNHDLECEAIKTTKESTKLKKPKSNPKKRGRKPKQLVPEQKNERKIKAPYKRRPKVYQCATCGRFFKSSHALKEHERSHSSVKAWKCQNCPKEFVRRDYYVRHIKTHETAGQFQCDNCDKAFHAEKLLQDHIRIKHQGDRPFRCQICHKVAYARASSLYTHIKIIHQKKQPFKCDICLRNFISKNCLERHINRHKGIKTSQCPHCEKRYESNNYLQHHIAVQHPEKAGNLPRCRYCSVPYSADSYYRKHVVAKHPEHFEEFEQWLKSKREAVWSE